MNTYNYKTNLLHFRVIFCIVYWRSSQNWTRMCGSGQTPPKEMCPRRDVGCVCVCVWWAPWCPILFAFYAYKSMTIGLQCVGGLTCSSVSPCRQMAVIQFIFVSKQNSTPLGIWTCQQWIYFSKWTKRVWFQNKIPLDMEPTFKWKIHSNFHVNVMFILFNVTIMSRTYTLNLHNMFVENMVLGHGHSILKKPQMKHLCTFWREIIFII